MTAVVAAKNDAIDRGYRLFRALLRADAHRDGIVPRDSAPVLIRRPRVFQDPERESNDGSAFPDANTEEVEFPPEKPQFLIRKSDYPAAANELRDLLAKSGDLFDRGRVLVALKTDAAGTSFTQEMLISNIIMKTHEFCQPVTLDSDGDAKAVTLPDKVARLYLDHGEWRVSPLAGISTAPLLRADGTIFGERGYDPVTQTFCDPPSGLIVPDNPSVQQAQAGLLELRSVFRTFPFENAVTVREAGIDVIDIAEPPGYAESAYLTGILTAVARPSLWLAPGILIVAPNISGSGAGKGLLVRAASLIAYGIAPQAFAAGRQEEFDKRLGAKLLGGSPVVFTDNVNERMLQSETLASVLTERPADVRVLGYSKMLPINSTALIALTGNALKVTADLVRRFLIVAIDPRMENPETRPFEPGFLDRIKQQRKVLLQHVLTILVWGRRMAGQLPRGRSLGSYEDWQRWVRDPLLALGCADPVEEMLVAKQRDPRRQTVSEIYTKWHERHQDDWVTVAGLHQDVLDLLNPQKRARQYVARAVERLVDTRLGGFVLIREKGGTWAAARYRLIEVREDQHGGHRGHRDHRDDGEDGSGKGEASDQRHTPPMTPMNPMPPASFLARERRGKNGDLDASNDELKKHRGHGDRPGFGDDPAYWRMREAALSRRVHECEESERRLKAQQDRPTIRRARGRSPSETSWHWFGTLTTLRVLRFGQTRISPKKKCRD